MKKLFGLLLFSTLLSAAAFAQSTDWSQWRGSARDGKATDVSVPQKWPKTLKEEWKLTVGVGHASPVAAAGKVYVFARQGEEEVLLCIDAASGKQLWRSANPVSYEMNPAAVGHGKGPKATPLVSNGNVYTFGISGILSANDAGTGTVKWRRDFSKEFPSTSPLYGTATSPLLENGMLIVHVGGQDKGALQAFDSETGAVKWSNNTDGPAYSSPVVVTLAGVRQIVTFMQKDVVGVDLASGKLLWRVPAKTAYDTNSVSPVIYKDMIIVAREEKGLTAFRLAKHDVELAADEVWSNKDAEMYLNTPVLEGNQLVGLSIRNKGQFYAIDADTGKFVWQSPGRMGENAAIVNAGGKVLLLLTNDANLIVQPAMAREFAPIGQYAVATSQTWAHPLVMGNRILIKDETTLKAFSF